MKIIPPHSGLPEIDILLKNLNLIFERRVSTMFNKTDNFGLFLWKTTQCFKGSKSTIKKKN